MFLTFFDPRSSIVLTFSIVAYPRCEDGYGLKIDDQKFTVFFSFKDERPAPVSPVWTSEINHILKSRLGMSVTTQGGSGRLFVTGL